MNTISMLRRVRLAFLLITALSAQGMAHCDTMDGPVVEAGRRAIAQNDVRYALVWVKPASEQEVRKAFEQTMAVRNAGPAARELADRYFFETLVRVHRAGEGAPYTGLKEEGVEPDPGIAAAEEALHRGSANELADDLATALRARVQEAFHRAHEMQSYQPGDVEAGRRYVEAYVHFIHYVDKAHQTAAPQQGTHGEAAEHHEHK
jgi:hypothetical protein